MILTTHVIKRGKQVEVGSLPVTTQFKVDVKCPQCEETRHVMLAGVIRAGHCICQKCSVRNASCKPVDIGEKHNKLTFLGKLPKGKAKFLCDCGNETIASFYSVRNGLTKSCGCLRKQNRFVKIGRGKDHPNWKGGVTAERERFMQTAEYKAWRTSVFERDSYTCQSCSQVGYALEAHHIEPYSKAKEKRVLVENGVTLCEDCHRDFHAIYGRKQFGEKEFSEFKARKTT